MKFHKFLLLIILFNFYGCVEEFDLTVPDAAPRVVVDGLITNKPGPYYIRFVKSKPGNVSIIDDNNFYKTDKAEPITDATIVITDDKGQRDTLKYTTIEVLGGEYGQDYYNQGFYATQKLQGIPGRTYFLEINWNKQKYSSSSYMQAVPVIENLGYKNVYSEAKKESHYVPIITFTDPKNETNYYLIQTIDLNYSRFWSTSTLWHYSILEDTHLDSKIVDLEVSTGVTPRMINYYPVYMEGSNIYVALSSISSEAYSYYKTLLEQFENDGGAYKPTPATPAGNISNGALGFFRASAVSEKTTIIPKLNQN